MGDAPRNAFDEIRDKWDNKEHPGAEVDFIPLLKERPKDKPFFFWLASIDAHRGWDDQIFLDRHDPDNIPVPKYLADDSGTREDLGKYYDEIARLDYFVGKIEKELENQGITENTMIIFMGDNGRPFPRCKTRVYDSGMKPPFIIKWPKGIRQSGSVCNSLVSAIDIAPTVLDVCELPAEDSFQGKSFARLFRDPNTKHRKYVFSEHNWHDHEALERMVRTEEYLYVLNERPQFPNCGPADSNNSLSQKDLDKLKEDGKLTAEQMDIFVTPRPKEELFDIKNDPEQFMNIAGDPKYKEALEKMRAVMQQWREETADTTPEHLTPDWYTRFTGQPLDIERKRGEMPGASKSATKVNAKGPF